MKSKLNTKYMTHKTLHWKRRESDWSVIINRIRKYSALCFSFNLFNIIKEFERVTAAYLESDL